MDNIPRDVELNKLFQAKRDPRIMWVLDHVLPGFLLPLCIFLMAVSSGIHFHDCFVLPVRLITYLPCFLLILGIWLPLICTIGIIKGVPPFLNSLFTLIPLAEFRIGQMFLFIAFFIAKAGYNAFKYGNVNFVWKVIIFWMSLSFVIQKAEIISRFASQHKILPQFSAILVIEFIFFLGLVFTDLSEPENQGRRRGQGRNRRRAGR